MPSGAELKALLSGGSAPAEREPKKPEAPSGRDLKALAGGGSDGLAMPEPGVEYTAGAGAREAADEDGPGVLSMLAEGARQGVYGLAESAYQTPETLKRVFMDLPNEYIARGIDALGGDSAALGYDEPNPLDPVTDFTSRQADVLKRAREQGGGEAAETMMRKGRQADQALKQALSGDLSGLGGVLTDPEAWAGFIGQAAPSLAVSALSGGSLKVIGWMEAMEGAKSAEEFEERTGVELSDQEYARAVAQVGLANAALEKAGIDKILKGGSGNVLRRALTGGVAEGTTEAGQEFNQNLGSRIYDPEAELTSGVVAGAMGGFGSGAPAGALARGDRQQERRPTEPAGEQTPTPQPLAAESDAQAADAQRTPETESRDDGDRRSAARGDDLKRALEESLAAGDPTGRTATIEGMDGEWTVVEPYNDEGTIYRLRNADGEEQVVGTELFTVTDQPAATDRQDEERPDEIRRSSGEPFRSANDARVAAKNRKLDGYEPVEIDDGQFVLRRQEPADAAGGTAPAETEAAPAGDKESLTTAPEATPPDAEISREQSQRSLRGQIADLERAAKDAPNTAVRDALTAELERLRKVESQESPKLSAAERAREARRVDPGKDDLVTAIRKLGGIDTDLENDWAGRLKGIGERRPGLPNLERPGKGRSLDDLAEALQERGYLMPREDETRGSRTDELAEKLGQVESGTPVYSLEREEAAFARDMEEAEAARAGDPDPDLAAEAEFDALMTEASAYLDGQTPGSAQDETEYVSSDESARILDDVANAAAEIDPDRTESIITAGGQNGDSNRAITQRLMQEVVRGRAETESGRAGDRGEIEAQPQERAQPAEGEAQGGAAEPRKEVVQRASTPEAQSGKARQEVSSRVSTVAGDEAAVPQPEEQEVSAVRRQGDNRVPRVEGELRGVPSRRGEASSREANAGPDRQQQGVRTRQRQMDDVDGAIEEQTELQSGRVQGEEAVSPRLGRGDRDTAQGSEGQDRQVRMERRARSDRTGGKPEKEQSDADAQRQDDADGSVGKRVGGELQDAQEPDQQPGVADRESADDAVAEEQERSRTPRQELDERAQEIEAEAEKLPIAVHLDDLPLSEATAAHAGTSMTPERRGRQRQIEYVADMVDVYWRMAPLADTEAKQETLKDELSRYKRGYLQRLRASLGADSRTMSPMVAGPSNFPARRNAKRNETARKRTDEFLDWRDRARKAMRKALTPEKQPVSSTDPDAVDKLRRQIEERQSTQEMMKAANRVVRKKGLSDEQRLAQLQDVGLSEAKAREALEPDFMGRTGFPDYVLQNNNAQIKRLKGRVAELEARQEQASEGPTEATFDGGTVEIDPAAGYVRVRHDEKPPADVRQQLKSNGFRWAPSEGAWRRKLNEQALQAAERVTGADLPRGGGDGGQDASPFFSRRRGQATPTTLTADEARATVDGLMGDWKSAPPVSVVQSEADLPSGIQNAIDAAGAQGEIRGVFWRGRAYVIADNVRNPAEAEETLLHEVAGHYGLRELLGEDFTRLLDDVYLSVGRRKLQPIADKYELDMDTRVGRRTAAEEHLAHIAQTNPQSKLWQRFVTMFRQWMRRMGFKLRLTDAEIRDLVIRARRFVETGERVTGTPIIREHAVYRGTRHNQAAYNRRGSQYASARSLQESWRQRGVTASISERGGILTLNKMTVRADLRGDGLGSQFMADLTRYADDTGQRIGLTPEGDFGADPARLRDWYKRFGFIDNTGRNRDYEISESMVREPDEAAFSRRPGRDTVGAEGIETRELTDEEAADAERYFGATDRGGLAAGRAEPRTVAGSAPAQSWARETRVRAPDGTPAILYRGSRNGLTAENFQPGALGGNTGYAPAGLGVWLTEDQGEAGEYGPTVEAFNVDLRNPRVYTVDDFPSFNTPAEANLHQTQLRRQGHDGVILDLSSIDAGRHVIAFDPEQVIRPEGDGPRFSRRRRSEDLERAMEKAGLGRPRGTLREWADSLRQLTGDRARRIAAEMSDALAQGAFDRFHGIKRAELNHLGNLPAEQSGYVAARLSTGVASTMRAVLHHGAPEWRGGVVSKVEGSKGLLDILDPVKADLDTFLGWMVARRAQRLLEEGRENLFTQGDIDRLREAGEASPAFDQFESTAAELDQFRSRILDLAQDAGLIDRDARAAWDVSDYIPFYRMADADSVQGPSGGGNGLSGQSSGIRTLKGGESRLNDPMENLLMNFTHLVDASLKNHAIRQVQSNLDDGAIFEKVPPQYTQEVVPLSQIKNRLREHGMNPDAVPQDALDGMAKLWAMKPPADNDVVRVMEEGKATYYRVKDPLLLKSLTAVRDPGLNNPLVRTMRGFKRVLTRGVTADPAFMARNFLRDMVHAWTINEDSFKLGVDSIRGVTKTLREEGGAIDMMFAGGSFLGGYVNANDPGETARALRGALRQKGYDASARKRFASTVVDTPAKWWEVYTRIGDAIENSSREAVFEAAGKAGKSRAQSIFEAKDLMDYSMRGDWGAVQFLADVIPFINARAQGLYKLGRAGANNPGRIAARGGMIAMASLALLARNWDDDRYEELPEWDKDTYWHVFFPEEVVGESLAHLRIPKPFEVGVLFGTWPERMARYIAGKDDGDLAFERFMWSIRETFAVDVTPQAVKPAIEVWGNRDSFRDAPIEGLSDQGKLPQARFDEHTSATAKALGRITGPAAGLSPKQLEHLWRGYTGSMGMYLLQAADVAARGATDAPSRPAMRIDDYPVVGTFLRSEPARSTKYLPELYDLHREVNQVYRTIRSYREQGNEEAARRLLEDNETKLATRDLLRKGARINSKIGQRLEKVYRNRDMTPEQKRKVVDELIQRRNDTTEAVMTRVKKFLEEQDEGR